MRRSSYDRASVVDDRGARPRLNLARLHRPSRWVGGVGRIAGESPPPDGVLQHAMDGHGDVLDARRRQPRRRTVDRARLTAGLGERYPQSIQCRCVESGESAVSYDELGPAVTLLTNARIRCKVPASLSMSASLGPSHPPPEGVKRADGASKGRVTQVNNGRLRSTTVTQKWWLSWGNVSDQDLRLKTQGGSIPPSSTASKTGL